MESYAITMPSRTAKISGSHGYRIDGDVAILNADLAVVSPEAQRAKWALQLWACEGPHQGGPLVGTKVAEALVDLSDAAPGEFRSLQAQTPVHLPAERHPRAMVLVLASGAEGTFEQVHDFANFAEPQPFFVPHFDGATGYSIEGSEVVLRAERVSNPRAEGNLSGSLTLELRAVPERQGAGASEGFVVASASIGRVAGQSALHAVEVRTAFSPPPAGQWRMMLALLEWTATGLATRDVCPFATPHRTEAALFEVPALPVEAVEAVNVVLDEAPTSSDAASVTEAAPAPEPMAMVAEEAPAPEPMAMVAEEAPAQAASVAEEAPAPAPRASVIEEAPPSSVPEGEPRLCIQTASVEELAQVKGLTRKLALEIVKARPFRSLDDLHRVRGIGEKTVRKLRSLLRV